jgi:hypothetical protein
MNKGFQMFIKVTQYAEHRKVSPRRVRQWIQDGKIRRNSWKWKGKQYRIDPAKADKDLSENLDRIHNPVRPSDELEQFPDPDQAERLEIQERAADLASTGEDNFPGGYSHPTPIWNIRYISALMDLDPDSVTVEKITKTKWRLRVDDIDNEDLTSCPWTVTMTFKYDLGGK